MDQLHKETSDKIRYLEDHGFPSRRKVGMRIKGGMEHDEDMKRYFEEYELVDPLQPRDAFYGGRTNAAKLLHVCQEGEELGKKHAFIKKPLLDD